MTWNNDNSMTENGDFRIGQEFNSLDHLKKNVKAWAISNNRNFRVIESEPLKYVIQSTNAEEKGCEWRTQAIMSATRTFKVVRYKVINKIAQGITVMTIPSLLLILLLISSWI